MPGPQLRLLSWEAREPWKSYTEVPQKIKKKNEKIPHTTKRRSDQKKKTYTGKSGADLKKLEEDYKDRLANPLPAASRGFIDDIVSPHLTRKIICEDLEVLRNKNLENPWKKHGNIPL